MHSSRAWLPICACINQNIQHSKHKTKLQTLIKRLRPICEQGRAKFSSVHGCGRGLMTLAGWWHYVFKPLCQLKGLAQGVLATHYEGKVMQPLLHPSPQTQPLMGLDALMHQANWALRLATDATKSQGNVVKGSDLGSLKQFARRPQNDLFGSSKWI